MLITTVFIAVAKAPDDALSNYILYIEHHKEPSPFAFWDFDAINY